MKKNKTDKKYIKRTGTVLAYIILILISAATVVLCAILQPGPTADCFEGLGNQPLLILLNAAPVFLTAFLAFGITNNAFVSGGLAYFIWMTLTYIDYLKTMLRNDPFIPRDILQSREGLYAVNDFNITVNYQVVAAIVGLALLFFVAGFFVRTVRCSWKRRVVRILIAVGFTVGAYEAFYDADNYCARDIYWNKLTVTDESNHTLTTEEVGFIYKFCYASHAYGFHEPEGYGEYDFEADEKAFYEKKNEEEKGETASAEGGESANPHVIMIMCEAFSDLTDNEVFTYTGETDPLSNYHRLSASDRAVSGHIVVPNVGAGTANTEFDVLTGVQTRAVAGDSNAFFGVRTRTETIATVLKEEGYKTFFTHPGHSWYYNRSSVYDYFGFDDLVFSEDSAYENAEMTGSLVSDKSVGDLMINEFEEAVSEGTTLYEFGVTIQNHMPYKLDRYGRTWGMTETVPLKTEVSQGSLETLSVYIEGVRAGDALLGRLADYFDASSEPVILVFFGDHQPSLGEDFSVFKELGITVGTSKSAESVMETYETPYIIWANSAAAEAGYGISHRDNYTISANYLGAMTLQAAGSGDSDPYFSFLLEAKNHISAVRDDYVIQESGNSSVGNEAQVVTDANLLPEKYKKIIQRMNCWGYYRIK